jgi:DNA-directed RNA polymerase subunit RPC12/RpoP
VAQVPVPAGRYDVVCPHCKKPFTADVLTGATQRHQGFKCPHCRLFVPFERADEQDLVEPAQ